MTFRSPIPSTLYGTLYQDNFSSELDEIAEQVRRLGFATLNSDFTADDLEQISKSFNRERQNYIKKWGEAYLQSINELHTIRAPLTLGDPVYVRLASNQNLMTVLSKLIAGKFILNQQNCIVNPPNENYSQGAWHRDLPYQHYVSNSPLAINALFCVDDFTLDNGSTFVLPASHKSINCPSNTYITANSLQIEAKAGQFILLDCMLFHSGGFNRTSIERRAINHVYTIPYFKQQIKLSGNLHTEHLSPFQQDLFGLNYQEPLTVEEYLFSRHK